MSGHRSCSHARHRARQWVQVHAHHHDDFTLMVRAGEEMDLLDLTERQRLAFYEVVWDVVATRRAARAPLGDVLPAQRNPLAHPSRPGSDGGRGAALSR